MFFFLNPDAKRKEVPESFGFKAAFILDARSGARSEFCSLQQLEKCGVRFSGASALNGAKSKNRLTRRFSRPVCEHLKGE